MPARDVPRLTLAVVLATAAGEVIVAAALLATLHADPFAALAAARWPLALQLLAGIAAGGALAALQIRLLASSPRWRSFSQAALGGTTLRMREIALISAAVGIAEELLFRAALQPLIGIGWTSLLFAAVHANYAPLRHDRSDWALSAAALATVFGLSVVLGLAYEHAGLAAAIVGHASYDFLVLRAYRRLFDWA